MNLFFRGDKLFEEAGGSAASCEKLMARLRQERRLGLWLMVGPLFVALAVSVWMVVILMRHLNSLFIGGLREVDPLPPWAAWFVAHREITWAVMGVLLLHSALQFVLLLRVDAWLKMVLFIRGRQGGQAQPG